MIVNKELLKNELREIGFTLWELHLYLDTHPEDRAALAEYNMCANKHKAALEHYERMFGSLEAVRGDNEDSWKWIQGPWPWEGVAE